MYIWIYSNLLLPILEYLLGLFTTLYIRYIIKVNYNHSIQFIANQPNTESAYNMQPNTFRMCVCVHNLNK